MWKTLLRRIVWSLPTLVGITAVAFFIMHLAPGDPGNTYAGAGNNGITRPELERLREYYGWDRPLWAQYAGWLGGALRLDFGRSFADGQPVATKIAAALPASFYLGSSALVLSLLVSIPVGVLCARRPNAVFDSTSGMVLAAAYSIPGYVLAVVLIRLFGVEWDLLPFRGIVSDNFPEMKAAEKLADLALHLIPVALCLACRPAVYQARFIRAHLLEASRDGFFRTARAKGHSITGALLRHALPNTLIPLITLVALSLPALLSGTVVLEVIFSWPGLGRLMVDATLARDFPTVMAVSVVSAVLVLVATLAADMAYARADPRVSHE